MDKMMHRTRRFRIDKRYLLIPQVKSPYVSTYTSDLPFSGWQKTEATHELTVKIGGRTLLAQHMAFGRKRPWWCGSKERRRARVADRYGSAMHAYD